MKFVPVTDAHNLKIGQLLFILHTNGDAFYLAAFAKVAALGEPVSSVGVEITDIVQKSSHSSYAVGEKTRYATRCLYTLEM
jgi:hypothetical protein